jgi:hypothetical protein
MRGAIPPLLLYVFMAWCLVKLRDNFTFYLLGRVWTGCVWLRIGTIGRLL